MDTSCSIFLVNFYPLTTLCKCKWPNACNHVIKNLKKTRVEKTGLSDLQKAPWNSRWACVPSKTWVVRTSDLSFLQYLHPDPNGRNFTFSKPDSCVFWIICLSGRLRTHILQKKNVLKESSLHQNRQKYHVFITSCCTTRRVVLIDQTILLLQQEVLNLSVCHRTHLCMKKISINVSVSTWNLCGLCKQWQEKVSNSKTQFMIIF